MMENPETMAGMRAARRTAFLLAAACLLAASVMASGPGEADRYFPASGPRSIFRDDFTFFDPGRVSTVSAPPTRFGCGVKLLCRGEESFKWRIEMLKKARNSIRVQTYIFTGDEIGKEVADRLIRKRRHGLEVKLIVDAYTKFKLSDRRVYADLELKGVTVMGFEPVYLLGVVNDSVLNVDDVNRRFHEKYWVIDDEVAFLGGTNIANEYARYGDDPHDKWRDQDVLLTGPVVADVARAFDDNYEYFRERRASRLPVNRPSLWSSLWWKVSGTTPPPVDPEAVSAPIVPAELSGDSVPVRFVRCRPRYHEDYLYQAYLHLFRTARESIIVENAYFVPNRPLIEALTEARRRGVEVTVITNCETTNDVSGMQPLTRYSYLPLIENGVAVYEWQGDHPGFGSLHSKFAVIDGQVAVIGSFNLDPRSIYLNSEDAVFIDSAKTARELINFVDSVDIPNSKRISLEQAKEWHRPAGIGDQFKLIFGIALEDWY